MAAFELVDLKNILISDTTIRERVQRSQFTDYINRYVLLDGEREIALMAIEFQTDAVVVHDVFVPPDKRRRGIGNRALKAAEDLARNQGIAHVQLVPPGFRDIAAPRILKWYRGRGYKAVSATWEKSVLEPRQKSPCKKPM